MTVDLVYDVGHVIIAQEFLDSNVWEQIPDFTTVDVLPGQYKFPMLRKSFFGGASKIFVKTKVYPRTEPPKI